MECLQLVHQLGSRQKVVTSNTTLYTAEHVRDALPGPLHIRGEATTSWLETSCLEASCGPQVQTTQRVRKNWTAGSLLCELQIDVLLSFSLCTSCRRTVIMPYIS